MSQPDLFPDRRASLAPSTYSSNSGSSYYSPQLDGATPPPPRTTRLTTAAYPTPQPAPPPARAPSRTNGARPPPPSTLTPAQAYQQSTGYGSVAPSPVSVVFPHRAPAPAPAAASQVSLATTASGISTSSTPSAASTSRSPPARRPTLNGSDERLRSPPPDYALPKAMSNLSFDGSGAGPLDTVAGIPKRGEVSELGSLVDRWDVVPEDHIGRAVSQPGTGAREFRSGSTSTATTATAHRRMASDSSLASSGGLTMTTMGGENGLYSQTEDAWTPDSPLASPSTPTGSENGFQTSAQRRVSGRKSMDSTQSLPLLSSDLPPGAAPSLTSADLRATSFSGGSVNRREVVAAVRSGSIGRSRSGFGTPLPSNRSLTETLQRSTSTRAVALAAMPYFYPALLSHLAAAFRQVIVLSDHVKNGITYKDAFDGKEAVSIFAELIKTSDRNLACIVGRCLGAQKWFHDVSYEHKLRDNPNELYQFKERLTAPLIPDQIPATDSPISEHNSLARAASSSSSVPRRPHYTPESSSLQMSDSQFSFNASSAGTPATSSSHLPSSSPQLMTKLDSGAAVVLPASKDGAVEGEEDLPTGVFMMLLNCYSPTCSRDKLCYSINCPRRLEQMKRLNMKPTGGLSRKLSHESIHDVKEATGTLWIHSVSQEILNSVDDTEKKRQEAINEVIYTERDFVRDLEYLREQWVKPLLAQDVVASSRREDFVRQVFWNVHDVLAVNNILAERLTKRQKQQPVVEAVGDLFLDRVPLFEPFVTYGAHQLFGKYEFEKEKGSNPAFQKFVEASDTLLETERKPESRRLELNGYLTKPTTRLGRYPLLLEAVLKYTPEDHPDKRDLPVAIKAIRGFLDKVNIESGKSENIFELAQLEQQLVFRPNETIDLRLRDKSRELVHRGPLKRRGGNRDEIADLMGFLFDHAFLLVKPKYVGKAEQYRVYRRPIPLELLVVTSPDEAYNAKLSGGTSRGKQLMSRTPAGKSTSAAAAVIPTKPDSKHGFSITIVHLGKKGYSMQLWVDTYVGRKKWLESIDKQQTTLREKSCVFTTQTITEGFFNSLRRVNCISPYDQGNRMIYGTDEGVYFCNLSSPDLRRPVKVINLLDVSQVDVIEEFQLLIVLHERSVTTFPLDCLDPADPNAALKRGKRISSHTSFFKTGHCLGKVLVAVVKSSTLSSTIKVMEPIDQSVRGKKPQSSFMKRLNGGNDALKLFKEFYIPTESSSVHFLKTKLCVGCTKGFEIVDLETLDMQGLLDPGDSSLDFVLKRDNVRPIAIYRIEEDFLLCYDEFAFYVNKNGWRSRPKWAIIWEGMPTAFALHYPYVLAFEPTFVEIHSVDTGHLVQIIPGNNISCLFADTPPSRMNAPAPPASRQLVYPPPGGYRHPSNPAFGTANHAHPGFSPQGGAGYGYPAQAGQMRPPPQVFPGSMAPPPMTGRFTRNQIIFTSDEGHVQFLKLPPAPTNPRSASHGHRPSH
ncbi:Rho1 guanine nucleotide exchange factor 1 [Saitozyma sp. JCM 24511]|nr:Rho1 guanine nucleotide exchange factor 1 [Saitozyma sp. JCM 24511]